MLRKSTYCYLVCALVSFAFTPAYAAIDFEGFGPTNAPLSEGTSLTVAADQGVTVVFETIDSSGMSHAPFIAQAGGPRVAFQSTVIEDTPLNSDGTVYVPGGDYSLTDGLRQSHDYSLTFSQNIEDLSLDIYDFRGDGTHALSNLGTDSVVLRTFDEGGNPLATDSYVLGLERPIDGNVVTLSVTGTGIRSALVDFLSVEGGTAIDNVNFTVAVPEPGSVSLLMAGCLMLVRLRRRRWRR